MLDLCRRSERTLMWLFVAVLPILVAMALPVGATGESGSQSSAASPVAPSEDRQRYIVVLEDSVDHPGRVAQRHAVNRDADLSHVYKTAIEGYAAEMTPAEMRAVRADPNVAYVERDHRGGAASQAVSTGVSRIFAPENAKLSIDESDNRRIDVDVAVLDTGINAGHPDLSVFARTDCSGESLVCVDNQGADNYGHGSHVAGIVGAIDNEIGVVGVAPGARLWSVKVLDDGGQGELAEYIAGIDWVTAHADEIEVANSSLRYFTSSNKALKEALEASVDAGVVHVVAAGNEGVNAANYVPANHPDVITVSALADFDGKAGGGTPYTCYPDGDDTGSDFSNWGSTVEVAAPGTCIRSTGLGSNYFTTSGTSMASPHVAGAAAVLASADNPDSQAEVEDIRDTIVESGNLNWEDDSGDGLQEPLLDVGDEDVFDARIPTLGTWSSTKDISPVASNLEDNVCTSWAQCFWVGGYTDNFGVEKSQILKLTKSWPWTKESAQTPSGAKSSRLSAVGCSYSDECVAAGSYIDSSGVRRPYALRWYKWLSPEWKLSGGMSSPEGASSADLTGIACGFAVCVSVGSYVEGGSEHALAYIGDGSAWSSPISEDPSGASSAEYSDVSCEYGNGEYLNEAEEGIYVEPRCVAVGSYVDGSEERKPLIVHYDASGYSEVLEIPSPAEAQGAELNDVSCDHAGRCMVVGSYVDGSGDRKTLAIRVIRGEATVVSTPNPGGTDSSELESISCSWHYQEEEAGPPECGAVGSYQGKEGRDTPLALRWNGTSWALGELTSLPGGPVEARYEGVACLEGTCQEVGSLIRSGRPSVNAAGGGYLGENVWTFTELPDASSQLTGLSCGSATNCIAVGDFSDVTPPEGSPPVLGWSFDGTNWQPHAQPGGTTPSLHGVSCSAANACTAFGNVSNNSAFLVRRWNGSSWSSQTAPMPASGTVEGRDISCPASNHCVGVGWNNLSSYPVKKTAISKWDGSSWTTTTPQIGYDAELHGASCTSSSFCFAVGRYRSTPSSAYRAVSLLWVGTGWTNIAIPQPSGATSSELRSVSCTSASACTAVGQYSASGGKVLVARWDGASWSSETITGPSSADDVSCWSDSGCRLLASGTPMKSIGGPWLAESIPSIGATLTELSCTAADHCVAGGVTSQGSYPVSVVVDDAES